MRYFLCLFIMGTSPIRAAAETHTAMPLSQVIQLVTELAPTYKERGLAFGFHSIESCLFVSQKLVVLKNYCYPKKNYPARGYTLISPIFGVMEVYEEVRKGGLIQRDVRITSFPEDLQKIFDASMENINIPAANTILETVYKQWGPACWTTNLSPSTGQPEQGCLKEDLANFNDWSSESLLLVTEPLKWNQMLRDLLSALK